MPICRPWVGSALLAFASLGPGPSAGAQEAKAQAAPSGASARETIAGEGNAAMERLRGTIGKQKDSPAATGPQLAPSSSQAERRRAFEAMRKRASSFQMEARARDALHAGGEKRAAEHDAMAKRLHQALGLEAPEMDAIARVTPPPAYKAWVPVLFVSSSMPLATLRAYAAQLERVSGVLALRGMPGGLAKVAPMAKLSAEILRLDPGCQGPACAMRNVQLIVDPMIFRQHGIARVPALGMIPGDPTQPYCERDDESPRAGHIIYGDAALSGLLDEYARLGGDREVADAQARLGNR